MVVETPLVEMSFAQGALATEQKVNLARKVTELVVEKQSKPKTTLGWSFMRSPWRTGLSEGSQSKRLEQECNRRNKHDHSTPLFF